MANWNSADSNLRLAGQATSVLVTIGPYVNSVEISGGNSLVDDTGLSDAVRSEARDIGMINVMTMNGFVNSTTEAIFGPCINGTAAAKTVEYKLNSNKFLSGTALIGTVSFSGPIGLQTFSAEARSNSTTGFSRTSVAVP